MTEHKIAVIGFSKCGTMSMVGYMKNKFPEATVSRPENIYVDHRGPHEQEKWHEMDVIAITRNPIDRIQSSIRYWPQVRKLYDDGGIPKLLSGVKNYINVGFRDPIEQSNYDKYIRLFEKQHACHVKVYKFEDMIKDKEFPHINESPDSTFKLTKDDRTEIQKRLDEAGIIY